MIDPWAELEITPTSDERAIKRAYVKKLKITNPEDNPEDFARLRGAYEQALRRAGWMARDETREKTAEAASTHDDENDDGVPLPPIDLTTAPPLKDADETTDATPGARELVEVIAGAFEREGDDAGVAALEALWASGQLVNVDLQRDVEDALLNWLVDVQPFAPAVAAAAARTFQWKADALGSSGHSHDLLAGRMRGTGVVRWLETHGTTLGAAARTAVDILRGRVDATRFEALLQDKELQHDMRWLLDHFRGDPALWDAFSEGVSERAWNWWSKALLEAEKTRDRRRRAFLVGLVLFAPLGMGVSYGFSKSWPWPIPTWGILAGGMLAAAGGALLHWWESTRMGPIARQRPVEPNERWHEHFVVTPWVALTVGSIAMSVFPDARGADTSVLPSTAGALLIITGWRAMLPALFFPVALASALSDVLILVGFAKGHWVAAIGCWYPPALGLLMWARSRAIPFVIRWNRTYNTVNWLACAATGMATIVVQATANVVRHQPLLNGGVVYQVVLLFIFAMFGKVWERADEE